MQEPDFTNGSVTCRTILLVEDEPLIAFHQSEILKQNGYKVITVFDPYKAIAAVNSMKIDLILMDIELGDSTLDGTDTARAILANMDIPLVFLSSHTEPAIVHKTESITSYGYVVKNSGETVLITSIKMAFRLHHAQTELLQSRAALSESEEKYRAAFVTSPDSITINSSQGIYVDVNDGFTVLTGYERDEVIGKLPKELNIWVSTEEQESFETQLKLRGLVQNLEARLRCRDGSIVTTLISARPIAIHDRIHILSITRDITQKKLIEDKLIMSEKRFKSMFNLSTEGILIGNNDGIITDANESLVRLCGYSRNELIGRKIDILFSAAVLEEDPLRYDLVRQGSVVRKKRPIITRDGTELMIVMSAAKVADDCLQMVFFQLAADQTAV